ncbi:MAG: permease [Gemmatimonadetes bacterium]|nr:permease [Gemmatimonadota bacterium]
MLRPGIRRLFRLPLRTSASIHADVDEELESLLAARIDAYVAHGMSPAAARDEALRRLGTTIESARYQLHQSADLRERRMRLHEHVENLLQDLRYAARGLARRPAFTAVAVLTLAIGIGATTAIFSAVNVLLLRPLPYAKPDELMKVTLVAPAFGERKGTDQMVWSYPKYLVFRDAQRVFQENALYSGQQLTVTSGDIERIRGEFVGATYFRTLGIVPVRGRDFDRSVDAHAGAPKEVILSYAMWERRFNADPAVVGRVLDLDREPYTIIGVAPRGFLGLTGTGEVFLPITTRPADDLDQPFSHEFWLVARRGAGVSTQQAATAVAVLGGRVAEAFPDRVLGNARMGAKAQPLDAVRISPLIKRSLLILFGAVSFVLLIACVNVANLLLGRASARRREIAVRLAIGAGRLRLVGLLLTESVLLALVGGAASIVVAWLGVHALSAVNPATTLRVNRDTSLGAVAFSSISLDWTALAFTLALTLVVGVLFGLVPAIGATRASLTDALKDGRPRARRGMGSASAGRHTLVVAEVALAVVLLAGSGLMIRSLSKLMSVDTGFDARNVLTVRLTVPPGGLARDSLPAFYTQLLERIRAVPGVLDAGLNNCAPLGGSCNGTSIRLLDRPKLALELSPPIGIDWVTPTWFSTMRVPLEAGRLFTDADRANTPKVTVINESAAKKFWPNESPIGKHVEIGQGGLDDAEVIGVVGDVRQTPDSVSHPVSYASYYQSPRAGVILFIRTGANPAALGADVRRAIHDAAPQYPVYDMQTMTDRAAAATAQARFSAALLVLFAATALSLAAIGIYGVMSLAVAARTREIGIRIALGADRARVQRLVVGEGLALVAAGAVIGLGGALVATRLLRSLLFDLTPSDPITYVTIVALLGVAAVVASWIPARRAARVDPVVALRTE